MEVAGEDAAQLPEHPAKKTSLQGIFRLCLGFLDPVDASASGNADVAAMSSALTWWTLTFALSLEAFSGFGCSRVASVDDPESELSELVSPEEFFSPSFFGSHGSFTFMM